MKLVIEDEAGTRAVVPFAGDELVIGRAAEGVACRLTDRDVSRRHARLVRSGAGVFVEDLGSLTGTRVNGEPISGRRRLRPGDLIQIGDYDLALLPEEDAPGAAVPPPLPGAREGAPASRPPRRGAARLAVWAAAAVIALALLAGAAAALRGDPAPAPAPAPAERGR